VQARRCETKESAASKTPSFLNLTANQAAPLQPVESRINGPWAVAKGSHWRGREDLAQIVPGAGLLLH
ncbi:MAG TPA: hypothetical protein VK505_10695, partial [Steroidobacteraceae bacterium]|nr:hypothetical protein [Steroidobacteraceae bacterium]